jgi:hypothetical protein
MKKLAILFISFSFFIAHGNAQTMNSLADEAYRTAELAYENEQFSDCVSNLRSCIELQEKTDARIQILLSKALFGIEDYIQAKVEVQKFFDLNPSLDDKYLDMTTLKSKIEDKLLEQKLMEEKRIEQERLAQLELDEWNNACVENTKDAYQVYLLKFPKGLHIKESRNKLEDFSWKEAAIMNTLESYKEYLSDFPDGANKSLAKSRIKEFEDEANYTLFKERGDEAMEGLKWKDAISMYESALRFKSGDVYVIEKSKQAQAQIDKENEIADLNSKISECEKERKKEKRTVLSGFIWTGVFVGGGLAASKFMKPSDVTDVVAGTGYLLAGICTFGTIVSMADAAKQKNTAKDYRRRIDELTIYPIIDPLYKNYGIGIVMKIP